jgi:hypothetical protein
MLIRDCHGCHCMVVGFTMRYRLISHRYRQTWLWCSCDHFFLLFNNFTFNNISVILWSSVLLVAKPKYNFILCDNVCQWLAAGQWFSQGTFGFATNKTELHNITEILLKVKLSRCRFFSRLYSWLSWDICWSFGQFRYIVLAGLGNTCISLRYIQSWQSGGVGLSP